MTLNCIDRAQSPTHKGNLLQGRKSSLSHQQNANHSRRNSCSPPLTKSHSVSSAQSEPKQLNSAKLERSLSDSTSDRKMVQNTNSSRYKTELCRPFEENGTCKYGDKCQFAHGHKELRSMSRHPKYKTELCRTFHSSGLCPYGPRCHFIHNNGDNVLSPTTPTPPPTVLQQPVIPVNMRPKLTSLSSESELSPPQSKAVSPTDLKCFSEMFTLSPTYSANDVFFPDTPANIYQEILDQLADSGKGNLNPGPEYSYVYRDDHDAPGYYNIDNHKCPGSPVLDLYPTGQSGHSPPPTNNPYNFLNFTIFDTFQPQIIK